MCWPRVGPLRSIGSGIARRFGDPNCFASITRIDWHEAGGNGRPGCVNKGGVREACLRQAGKEAMRASVKNALLSGITVRVLSAALNISEPYAAEIRAVRYLLHLRHGQALARLVASRLLHRFSLLSA